MPTYLPNVVRGLNAYGYGDTRNGLVAYTPIYEGFPEYSIKINSSFFVETGSLFVPIFGGDIPGFYITYLQPGWSYRSRNSIRPNFVPFRKDFFTYQGQPQFTPPTIVDGFNKLNSVGEDANEVFTLNVIQISQAGFLSYSARTLFTEPKNILVSAYGQFTLQYIAFPWPYATSPNQPRNFDGMQIGTMIKFFTEDQYSIISFDSIETISSKMNIIPEPEV